MPFANETWTRVTQLATDLVVRYPGPYVALDDRNYAVPTVRNPNPPNPPAFLPWAQWTQPGYIGQALHYAAGAWNVAPIVPLYADAALTVPLSFGRAWDGTLIGAVLAIYPFRAGTDYAFTAHVEMAVGAHADAVWTSYAPLANFTTTLRADPEWNLDASCTRFVGFGASLFAVVSVRFFTAGAQDSWMYLLRSRDGGASWTAAPLNLAWGRAHDLAATGAGSLLLVADNYHRSTDAGLTWSTVGWGSSNVGTAVAAFSEAGVTAARAGYRYGLSNRNGWYGVSCNDGVAWGSGAEFNNATRPYQRNHLIVFGGYEGLYIDTLVKSYVGYFSDPVNVPVVYHTTDGFETAVEVADMRQHVGIKGGAFASPVASGLVAGTKRPTFITMAGELFVCSESGVGRAVERAYCALGVPAAPPAYGLPVPVDGVGFAPKPCTD